MRDTGCGMIFIGLMLVLQTMPAVLKSQVRTGAERTEAWEPLLKGKTVGVVANSASVAGGVNTVDLLIRQGVKVSAVLAPEHGFRMEREAGEEFGNAEGSGGYRVISLYGTHKKPTRADLSGLEAVVFDLQDVGVRFFTYISTLAYVMEACAEAGLPLFVFDRPNPNGDYVDGPVLEKQMTSFVGLHPVPVVYGMTIGEYARMVNGEGWLKDRVQCDLRVIGLENYQHSVKYELPVRPSPNLPDANAVRLYPSLCLFEGTVVSVARGTDFPFGAYGHPRMKSGTFSFVPESRPGASLHPFYEGKRCFGYDLRNLPSGGQDKRINLSWLIGAYKELHADTAFFNDYFDRLAGTADLRSQVIRGVPEKEIRRSWQPSLEKFRKTRQKYLLYK